jgi:hypothetical protein
MLLDLPWSSTVEILVSACNSIKDVYCIHTWYPDEEIKVSYVVRARVPAFDSQPEGIGRRKGILPRLGHSTATHDLCRLEELDDDYENIFWEKRNA